MLKSQKYFGILKKKLEKGEEVAKDWHLFELLKGMVRVEFI